MNRKPIGHVRFTRKQRPGARLPYLLQKRTVVSIADDGTPLEQTETFSYASEHERDAVLRKARALAHQQHAPIGEALHQYVASRRRANQRLSDEELSKRAERTLQSVEQRLRGWFRPHLERSLLTYLESDAKARYDELAGTGSVPPWISPHLGRPLSGDTVLVWVNEARAFFEWAKEAELLPRERANPLARIKVRLPRNTGKDQPSPRDRATLQQYVERQVMVPMAYLTGRKPVQTPVDLDALHVGVLLVTGCRPSELLNRRPEDIHPRADGAAIVVPAGRGKNKNASRTIYVPAPLGLALLRMRAARTGQRYLMPYRAGSWSVKAVRRVCTRAGVRFVVPYAFRGASISARLREQLDPIAREHGQGSGAIPERHYISPQVRDEAEQAVTGEHRRQMGRVVLEGRLEAVLEKLRHQGLFGAEPGLLPILATRLAAEIERSAQANSPETPPSAGPDPTEQVKRTVA